MDNKSLVNIVTMLFVQLLARIRRFDLLLAHSYELDLRGAADGCVQRGAVLGRIRELKSMRTPT